jgi:hypothetical protein
MQNTVDQSYLCKSIAQRRAASRSVAQHRAASRSIAQHRVASRDTEQHKKRPLRLTHQADERNDRSEYRVEMDIVHAVVEWVGPQFCRNHLKMNRIDFLNF